MTKRRAAAKKLLMDATALDFADESFILPEEKIRTEYGIIGTDVAQSSELIMKIWRKCALNPLEHEKNGEYFHIVLKK